ncbi:helix-turn-helix domain-containing protein [Nakamurella sp. YIM 132084]|uniref:Helix-turn-helix domain-containing protein n=1 Tax=Nakamurella leprariae TaxID=2803911 RepID=A0A938YCA3_9ACTN|nr:helix-turn-helix domain-containing protein [Nakamurella leprariae]
MVLTIEEAAERLGIGRTLMYSLMTSGEVDSVQIGRLRRVPTEALTDFVARLRRTGLVATPD